jgi:hypothetical protein
MHTPTFSMISQTRSPLPCSLMAMHLLCHACRPAKPLCSRLAGLWRRSLGTNYARWAFQPRRIFEPVSVA